MNHSIITLPTSYQHIANAEHSIRAGLHLIGQKVHNRIPSPQNVQFMTDAVATQKCVTELAQQRNQKKRPLFDTQDQIEQKKDGLICDVEARLHQKVTRSEIFTIRWSLA